jgi:transposase InsO family protein
VTQAIKSLPLVPNRTAYRRPWQNGTAERFIGSVRRELLDHVVVLNEAHLRRLLCEYLDYYNRERVHTVLRDSPVGRPIESRPSIRARVIGSPRAGGLHHRYAWREAS